jgi:hypothetical protein
LSLRTKSILQFDLLPGRRKLCAESAPIRYHIIRYEVRLHFLCKTGTSTGPCAGTVGQNKEQLLVISPSQSQSNNRPRRLNISLYLIMDNELGSASKPFTVVLFPCDNSVEDVPTKWISSDKKTCLWPNKSLKRTVLQKLTGDPNSCPRED